MLTHAGVSLGELVPGILPEAPCPTVAVRKAEQVEIIRRRRDEYSQDVSFGARPFILCGMPIRRLSPGTLKYVRRNGRFFLEIVGHPNYGVPFGQDRLVLLWLATMAVRQKSPVIRFDSAAEILVELGMPTNGSHYRRLQDAFQRVFASTIFFGTKDDFREAQVWDCGRGHFLDHMRLWFGKDGAAPGPASTENVVTLSTAFWHELSTHPIPVDTEVVRALANNAGCLDLYTWLTWRCYHAKGTQRVPLFGPAGLASQLGVQEYARERKFRERIRQWLKLVHLCWPACPATVSTNGAFLELHRSQNIDKCPGRVRI